MTTEEQPVPHHRRRRVLTGLAALTAAGGAAVFGWFRQQSRSGSETVAGRTVTASTIRSSVVDEPESTSGSSTGTNQTREPSDGPDSTEPSTSADDEAGTGNTDVDDEQPEDPPSPQLIDVPVICRSSWRAAPAEAGMEAHTVERLTVHHTASPISRIADGPGNIRGHQRFHQVNRGWPDIAYHVLVDPAGNIYQGRDPGFRGDTATNYDPTGHFLVCLEGDYDRAGVNDDQISSLALVLAWAVSSFGAPVDTLAGHRDYADTQCPGDAVYRLLTDGSLAERVNTVLAAGRPTMVSICGPDGDGRISEIEASTRQV